MTIVIDAVLQSWGEILQAEELTEESNFFELGGDSVLSMMVVFSISEALGMDLPPEIIFEAPTPRDFAEAVGRIRVQQAEEAKRA